MNNDATPQIYGVPQEPGLWQALSNWLADLSSQQVPGSVVILIVLAMAAPYVFKLITAWIGRKQ